MSTAAESLPLPTSTLRMRRLRTHLVEIKYELLKLMRLPGYVIPTLTFPLIFYIFFGIAFGQGKVTGSTKMAAYLIATYGTFGVMGASMLGIGINLAIERGQGWLQVKRATPMPMSAFLMAKIAVAVSFGSVIVLGLFILGASFGGVRFAPAVWAQLFATLVAGTLPFCALGLTLGYWAGPNSAPAIANLIYLPLSFASGLWIPIDFLPKFVQKLALFLPPYHLSQLTLRVIGAGKGPAWAHVLALASYSVLFLLLASAGYAKDEGKTYG
ncbi:MAG TPA: ABC transporter permease [Thermoanaerobaculia bacterium]|nr:ABC transporter permease [Thermoanaerobaculia bacterium]